MEVDTATLGMPFENTDDEELFSYWMTDNQPDDQLQLDQSPAPMLLPLPLLFPVLEEGLGTPDFSSPMSDEDNAQTDTKPIKTEKLDADEEPQTETKTRKKRVPTKRKTSKRPAKKQKKSSGDSSFILSLKGMNSAELEHYASTHSLALKEQTELKKYIRAIKNRESAQLSRERRKDYQKTLEHTLEDQTGKSADLQRKITELEVENKVLRNEYLQFKQLIEDSSVGKAYSLFSDNHVLRAATNTAAGGDAQAKIAFAVYLLIALHSFGQDILAKSMSSLPSSPVVEARA